MRISLEQFTSNWSHDDRQQHVTSTLQTQGSNEARLTFTTASRVNDSYLWLGQLGITSHCIKLAIRFIPQRAGWFSLCFWHESTSEVMSRNVYTTYFNHIAANFKSLVAIIQLETRKGQSDMYLNKVSINLWVSQ